MSQAPVYNEHMKERNIEGILLVWITHRYSNLHSFTFKKIQEMGSNEYLVLKTLEKVSRKNFTFDGMSLRLK